MRDKIKTTLFSKQNSFSFPLSHFSFGHGFTLIELLVVFSIIAVLTALGVESYSSFNGHQALKIAATDVATMMQTAKSRAIAQAIPSSCASGTFTGYEVDISIASSSYTLYANCGSNKLIAKNNLPQKVTFAAGSTTQVNFMIGTGNVPQLSTITVKGYGVTPIVITVDKDGNTMVN